MKVVYARADKVPEDMKRRIKADSKYHVRDDDDGWFRIIDENGMLFLSHWDEDPDGIHWTRLEYPYRDPEAVEALIEATRVLDLVEVGKALARLSPDAALGGE